MVAGDKLRFRNIDKWGNADNRYNYLKVTGSKAKVYGKLAESLTPEFAASTSITYKLANMFSESAALVDASGLNLNGIMLTDWCYYGMFQYCTSLAGRIDLPATLLAKYCYVSMFDYNGIVNKKEVHMPKSLSGSFNENMILIGAAITVIYDL